MKFSVVSDMNKAIFFLAHWLFLRWKIYLALNFISNVPINIFLTEKLVQFHACTLHLKQSQQNLMANLPMWRRVAGERTDREELNLKSSRTNILQVNFKGDFCSCFIVFALYSRSWTVYDWCFCNLWEIHQRCIRLIIFPDIKIDK